MEQDSRDKLIVDIRKKTDYEKETYPGAVNIYWEEWYDHKEEIPKNKPVYLICYTDIRATEIADRMQPEGYEVYAVENGIQSYLR